MTQQGVSVSPLLCFELSFAPLWVCVKTLLYSYDSLSLAYAVKLIAALQLLCIAGELVNLLVLNLYRW
jgi:hypothetical protein